MPKEIDRPGLTMASPSRRWLAPVILAVTTLLVLAVVYAMTRPDATAMTSIGPTQPMVDRPSGARPAIGQPLSDFAAEAIDGSTVRLSALKGRPVWLVFGGSWCAGCRIEAPDVQAAYLGASAQRLAVIGIYLSEDAAAVRDFTTRLGLTFTHVPDPSRVLASGYGVTGVPVHYFVDRSGILRGIEYGQVSPEQIRAQLAFIAG